MHSTSYRDFESVSFLLSHSMRSCIILSEFDRGRCAGVDSIVLLLLLDVDVVNFPFRRADGRWPREMSVGALEMDGAVFNVML